METENRDQLASETYAHTSSRQDVFADILEAIAHPGGSAKCPLTPGIGDCGLATADCRFSIAGFPAAATKKLAVVGEGKESVGERERRREGGGLKV